MFDLGGTELGILGLSARAGSAPTACKMSCNLSIDTCTLACKMEVLTSDLST